MARYTKEEILDALGEMVQDNEAYNAFCADFSKVLSKHAVLWIEKKKKPRIDGILVDYHGLKRLKCPQCNSLNMTDATFCGQCGNQIQDSWLEKIRKKNLGIE